jgi:DNA-binding transcriptional regulator YiaG
VTQLREIRVTVKVSQRQFAALLRVSPESYRAWESGRRQIPATLLRHAIELAKAGTGDALLPLSKLARELRMNEVTLRSAARDGRLVVTYDPPAFLGRPVVRSTRSAVEDFRRTYYRQTTRWTARPEAPLLPPLVPHDYDQRLVHLRTRLRLTQTQLAVRIGAAGKAVIYQWESRKRQPSPLLWRRVVELEASDLRAVQRPGDRPGPHHDDES